MKKELKQYENKPALASHFITATCGIHILDIINGIEDYVIVKGYIGDLHKYKLYENSKGLYFTYCNGCRYFINDFLRNDF